MTRSVYRSRAYDIRVVDQFYAYCRAKAALEAHRRKLARSWRSVERIVWKILFAGGFIGYCLSERVSQAMSLL